MRVAVVASAQIFGGFQNLPPLQSLDFPAFFGLSHLFPPRPSISVIFDTDLVTSQFPWALTVLNDTQKRTLPIAISGFFGQHQFTQWGYVFAMSVASLLPVLIIFICCQKYFVSGLQTGGIKG